MRACVQKMGWRGKGGGGGEVIDHNVLSTAQGHLRERERERERQVWVGLGEDILCA